MTEDEGRNLVCCYPHGIYTRLMNLWFVFLFKREETKKDKTRDNKSTGRWNIFIHVSDVSLFIATLLL